MDFNRDHHLSMVVLMPKVSKRVREQEAQGVLHGIRQIDKASWQQQMDKT